MFSDYTLMAPELVNLIAPKSKDDEIEYTEIGGNAVTNKTLAELTALFEEYMKDSTFICSPIMALDDPTEEELPLDAHFVEDFSEN
jgi:hypothetical protein